MNNAELADALAAANGLTKADARKAVDAVFAAITAPVHYQDTDSR